ncbi:MAG: NADH-quinone oxidoreductase subunit A [Chloroflexi bacterium]|nr:NADH-quinone oxidoreductase subunit A [Chloroflexota bacterium]MCY3957063.1 NADH-quinone oxidoreductase subunit A [Chloroflexota bacterium]
MPSWVAIVILMAVAFLFAVGSLVGTLLLKPRRKFAAKVEAYESGMPPIGDARGRHNIRFYLVAVTFLIFDVELLFFYPWALYFNMIDDQLSLFLAGVVFILILAVAFVYEWRKGALDWNR